MPRDPVQEVIEYNRRFVGRYDAVLRAKLDRLAANPFGFFRGTFHLFARDWVRATVHPPEIALPAAAELKIVADIHGENFGTFKAADGTVRYDINDFDETTRGRLDFDCCRAAVSLLLAAGQIGIDQTEAMIAVHACAIAYAQHIGEFARQERAAPVPNSDKDLPQASVARQLIQDAAAVRRADYIASLTTIHKGRRELTRGDKYFELHDVDRQRAERLLTDYVRRLGSAARKQPGFYDVEDICGRVAGCGSLGRYRFAVLIAGHEDEGKNLLLEFKEALPSGLDLCRSAPATPAATPPIKAPAGPPTACRAAEVADTARHMQSVSNRYLGYAVDGDDSFQAREIGPRERRLEWKIVRRKDEFAEVAALHAQLLARAHAQAALADPADRAALLEVPAVLRDRQNQFVAGVADFAAAYASLVLADHQAFVKRQAEVAKALGVAPPTA